MSEKRELQFDNELSNGAAAADLFSMNYLVLSISDVSVHEPNLLFILFTLNSHIFDDVSMRYSLLVLSDFLWSGCSHVVFSCSLVPSLSSMPNVSQAHPHVYCMTRF